MEEELDKCKMNCGNSSPFKGPVNKAPNCTEGCYTKNDDLEKSKEDIKEILTGEIMSRYYYQRGRIKAGLNFDIEVKKAVEILRDKKVNFEFDGDMQPDVALNKEYQNLYPFSKIVGNANILIMPGQHSAAISYKMMKELGDTKVIGPLLIGLGLPIEIAPLRSSTSEILNLASIAAYSADVIDYEK